MAVIRFGNKYKQWNAAFDAGYCAALGTPYVTLHAEDLVHPLKEVDAAAMARFLLTDESSWITGQIIGVDGGRSKLT